MFIKDLQNYKDSASSADKQTAILKDWIYNFRSSGAIMFLQLLFRREKIAKISQFDKY